VSLHILRTSRSESFSYIGRESHGALHIALSVLVLGLSIGVVFGPSGNTQAGLNTPLTATMAAVEKSAPATYDETVPDTAKDAEDNHQVQHVQIAPVLEAPRELILASIPPAPAPDPEEKRNLKVRSGDTLMSIMLSAGIGRDVAHDAVSALRAVYDP
ncbi:unnamed protein product, partial [Discosporangium mesarthrocarpum]